MLNVIWWVVSGFFIGLIARAVLPGVDTLGFLMTTIVGIAGSLVGGYLGGLMSKPKDGAKFSRAGFLMSVVGAVILLVVMRYLRAA
jgi:uncharacterized membrane protein YeaQ/YmgE (transglycosylase-associated protein family)